MLVNVSFVHYPLRSIPASIFLRILSFSLLVLSLATPLLAKPILQENANNVVRALTKNTVSPDELCGGVNGHTCPTGGCCSRYGYWVGLRRMIFTQNA